MCRGATKCPPRGILKIRLRKDNRPPRDDLEASCPEIPVLKQWPTPCTSAVRTTAYPMKPPTLDRRAHQRYDVLGALWGVLEIPEPATVVNVSTQGMLIDAPICPVPNSVHSLHILIEGEPVTVEAIVRHCRPHPEGRHLIGLAFLHVPATVLSSIEQLGAGHPIQVIDSEVSRS